MRDQQDELVERVLAGLREAKVPEGMEARIAERMVRPGGVAADTGRGSRRLVFGAGGAGMWWRGAVAGGAVVGLAMGVVLGVVVHGMRGGGGGERGREAVRQSSEPGRAHVVVEQEERTCVGSDSGARRAAGEARVPRPEMLRVESVLGSGRGGGHGGALGFGRELTPQERGLVQLARTADVQELASLNPEARAKKEAEDAAEFQRFFAKPAVKVAAAAEAGAGEAGASAGPVVSVPAGAETQAMEATETGAAPAEPTTGVDTGEKQ